jgi:putative membrane protein
MLVVGIIYGLFYQVEKVFEEQIEKLANESAQTLESMSFSVYFFIVVLVIIFSVLISLVLTIFKYFDLKLQKDNSSFILSFGLLNTKKINIPISKIQLIAWHNNPLRQLLKFKTLNIKQAVSGSQTKKSQRIDVPACNSTHQKNIEEELFGVEEPLYSVKNKSHPLYFIRSFLFLTLLFSAISLPFLFKDIRLIIPVIIVVVIIATMLVLAYHKRYFRISENRIEISKGQIGKVIYHLRNYKIQSVSFKQNIFIKRRKLASIVIYTAAGESLTMPYIPEELAMSLYNFVLYKIESTEKAWM